MVHALAQTVLVILALSACANARRTDIDSMLGYVSSAVESMSSSLRGSSILPYRPVFTRHALMGDAFKKLQIPEGRSAAATAGPLENAYSSGWYYGEVTSAQECDTDDWGGENDPVTIEGYALNVCILQGGFHIRYQCDGGESPL
jgi:hypothetical protein